MLFTVESYHKFVAIDQVQEHSVRQTKELMVRHGAKPTITSAQIYSRANDGVGHIIKNFDQESNVRKESSKHQRRRDVDIQIVVKVLGEIQAFKEIPGMDWTYPKGPNFWEFNSQKITGMIVDLH